MAFSTHPAPSPARVSVPRTAPLEAADRGGRDRLRDVTALALVAAVALVATALATADPADPPAATVFPPNAEATNACGLFGATVATTLFAVFGLAAWLVVAFVAVLAVVLLRRIHLADLPLRCGGAVAAIASLCTLLALLAPAWLTRPLWGAGGYVGATGVLLVEGTFAHTGGVIISIALAGAGLFLALDTILLAAFARLQTAVARLVAGLRLEKTDAADEAQRPAPRRSWLGRLVARGGGESAINENDDEDADEDADEAEEEDEPSEPRIRMRHRGVVLDEDAEDDLGEEAEESYDQADAADEASQWEADEEEAEAEEDVSEDAPPVPIRSRATRRSKAAEIGPELVPEGEYHLPSLDLLLPSDSHQLEAQEQEVREKARLLEKTFASFGFKVRVVEIETGPVISQYEIELEAGLRLAKIANLADDLAIALRVPSVRIVAPIPGKNTVGIEVPNTDRQIVRLREVIEETASKSRSMKIPVYLGKDVAGSPMTMDLATMPHLLIAGRTGTGKSVCLNSIITSILMSRRPDEVRMLMIDPKMVELTPYKTLPHLMHPVVTDMKKAEAILAWAVEKMEQRYALLAAAGVRHISKYNELGREEVLRRINPASEEEAEAIPESIPFIVVVADEIADMMMTAGKEIEQHIIRLAQKSRAVGIHLVLATQKPTVDVITGLIKSNLPARIAFQVASRTDSRVVLDEGGADKLLGNGDMLFLYPGTSTILRGQGTFVSDDEINRVMAVVGTDSPQYSQELVNLKPAGEEEAAQPGSLKPRDELYQQAVEVVIREGRGSVSLLQRALGIGYGRGARLIDFMAEDGIVGGYNGSQAREVLMTLEEWAAACGEPAPPADAPPRRLKVRPHAEDDTDEEDTEDAFACEEEQDESFTLASGEPAEAEADLSEYEEEASEYEDEDEAEEHSEYEYEEESEYEESER
jgi:DNA segregation ATPase FtsK/SpoIIIE, S-DNA-T family